MQNNNTLKINTRVIHASQRLDDDKGSIMPVIYPSAIFEKKTFDSKQKYLYSRCSNPTRDSYETCLTNLESGKHGYSFASGMSAAATILELLDVNSHIIVIDNLYGGNQYLFDTIRKKTAGLSCSYIDMTDISLIQSAVRENTRMIWVESPTNPLLQIVDLSAIVKIGRDNNILTVMDNTLATPFLQRPLEFGFDIVLHSATKYLNGHSDIINGAVIIGDNDILAEKLLNLQIGLGAIPSPFDCYSVMRGIKTLAVRMERHCENALELAQWLEKHPCIDKVYYPGLSSHPQHKLAAQQMFLYGGVISVLIKGGIEQVKRFVTSCELFTFTSSLGGTESTMAHPATMSHSLLSKNRRTQLGILDNLIRLSVGIEDIEDLKSDLEIHLREA